MQSGSSAGMEKYTTQNGPALAHRAVAQGISSRDTGLWLFLGHRTDQRRHAADCHATVLLLWPLRAHLQETARHSPV